MEDVKTNNPLYLEPIGSTTERAIINVLNIITREMFAGRVEQQGIDTEKNTQDAATLKTQTAADNEAILDLDFRVSELEG